MTDAEQTLYLIKGIIFELPAADQEAIHVLVESVRSQLAAAGDPKGTLALALIGAELQLGAAK